MTQNYQQELSLDKYGLTMKGFQYSKLLLLTFQMNLHLLTDETSPITEKGKVENSSPHERGITETEKIPVNPPINSSNKRNLL